MLDKFLHFFRRNDKDHALELLYAWLGKNVYYTANYILQDRHLAEEVTQETFFAAHRNLERLRDAHKVKAWLVQIADQISVTLYLERKEGSTWKTISGGYSLSKPNAVEISHSQNVTVTSGYCYRTRAVHKVVNDGVSESKVSYLTQLQM